MDNQYRHQILWLKGWHTWWKVQMHRIPAKRAQIFALLNPWSQLLGSGPRAPLALVRSHMRLNVIKWDKRSLLDSLKKTVIYYWGISQYTNLSSNILPLTEFERFGYWSMTIKLIKTVPLLPPSSTAAGAPHGSSIGGNSLKYPYHHIRKCLHEKIFHRNSIKTLVNGPICRTENFDY